ncbi:MAG TPA: phosphotransferase [Acidimicrobiales bacterium]|nr:phosphotransferase [Acidimicrobiales bacterium]
MTLAAGIEPLLPAYLGRQRWFAGEAPSSAEVVTSEELADGLLWLLADAGGALYQVVIGTRAADDQPDFLHGHDVQVLGVVDGQVAFDALLDPEYAKLVLAKVCPDLDAPSLMRPMGAEQSNSSLVFDDAFVLKVFRRLHDGPNPDVEITTALAAAGFGHVAEPFGVWRQDNRDLAIAARYLAGGAEGWALAQTSLRDLYATGYDDPGACGGDFAAEATRLGTVTATMHLALAEQFGAQPADPAAWADALEAQLSRLAEGDADPAAAKDFVERLRAVGDAGPAIRVHGDYHLGQVMRTDTGWFVLDFEGEPVRPLEERRQPTSPMKDVGGMLRSFHYAAQVALTERDEMEHDELLSPAVAWERRNQGAFLAGYFGTEGIDAVLPGGTDQRDLVLASFELDKAVYEVLYERAYRPDLVHIPLGAIARLLRG